MTTYYLNKTDSSYSISLEPKNEIYHSAEVLSMIKKVDTLNITRNKRQSLFLDFVHLLDHLDDSNFDMAFKVIINRTWFGNGQ